MLGGRSPCRGGPAWRCTMLLKAVEAVWWGLASLCCCCCCCCRRRRRRLVGSWAWFTDLLSTGRIYPAQRWETVYQTFRLRPP